MNTTQDDDARRGIAQAITRYLANHPNAADTVDGIAAYWLTEIEESAAMFRIDHIQRALDQLVRQGVLTTCMLPGGHVLYRKPPVPQERA
ncbi:hypothetical protein BTI_3881 [Burkholderia thailandensis MSMB121]|uniref:hypothetical protein n=1 Tax=Burkholderia TaxID=32008 RepID=UPI000327F6A3|nr:MULTISPECIES: hypothetical protein [Burkholderia]AGK50903.1 hypothetical protein BTI_3881 [Burkholderia thailandensis MSMB121]ATF32514.1 hypothetical protein CO709_03260 [Burkholderia thailandensis]KST70608.1 hypothetical protein WS76_18310 [Burkholderia humptydooensis]